MNVEKLAKEREEKNLNRQEELYNKARYDLERAQKELLSLKAQCEQGDKGEERKKIAGKEAEVEYFQLQFEREEKAFDRARDLYLQVELSFTEKKSKHAALCESLEMISKEMKQHSKDFYEIAAQAKEEASHSLKKIEEKEKERRELLSNQAKLNYKIKFAAVNRQDLELACYVLEIVVVALNKVVAHLRNIGHFWKQQEDLCDTFGNNTLKIEKDIGRKLPPLTLRMFPEAYYKWIIIEKVNAILAEESNKARKKSLNNFLSAAFGNAAYQKIEEITKTYETIFSKQEESVSAKLQKIQEAQKNLPLIYDLDG